MNPTSERPRPPLVILLVLSGAAILPQCRTRFEPGSTEQTVLSGDLIVATRQRAERIQAQFDEHQKAKLQRLVAEGRIGSAEDFRKKYPIVIGETDSCFHPAQMPGRVGLGIEDDKQQAQLLGNMKAILDFATTFYEAMGGLQTNLFRVIEICGVGRLAKHLPSQERTKLPLEIQGSRLIVWNDKFVGGYETLRSDALFRQWNQGQIESELSQGDLSQFAKQVWPLINPVGTLRRTIRDRIRRDVSEAKQDMRGPSGGVSNSPDKALKLVAERHLSQAPAGFRDATRKLLSADALTPEQKKVLSESLFRCLSEEKTVGKLEEAGTCNGLARANQVTADQFNFALLVNVSNFHNIGVNASACAGDRVETLFSEPLPNEFNIKQRCAGLLVSVCTVDNVQVFASASLQKGAAPTWCIHRSLEELEARFSLFGLPSL